MCKHGFSGRPDRCLCISGRRAATFHSPHPWPACLQGGRVCQMAARQAARQRVSAQAQGMCHAASPRIAPVSAATRASPRSFPPAGFCREGFKGPARGYPSVVPHPQRRAAHHAQPFSQHWWVCGGLAGDARAGVEYWGAVVHGLHCTGSVDQPLPGLGMQCWTCRSGARPSASPVQPWTSGAAPPWMQQRRRARKTRGSLRRRRRQLWSCRWRRCCSRGRRWWWSTRRTY